MIGPKSRLRAHPTSAALLILLLVVVTVASCGAASTAQQPHATARPWVSMLRECPEPCPGVVKVSGYVLEAGTGRPIADVPVRVESGHGALWVVYTNPDGYYEVRAPLGSIHIKPGRHGYAAPATDLVIRGAETVRVVFEATLEEIDLSAPDVPAASCFRGQHMAEVIGIVRTSTSMEPVLSASVWLPAEPTCGVQTDEYGRFRLAGLWPGETVIRVSGLAHKARDVTVDLLPGEQRRLEVLMESQPVALGDF